ncbi:MAG: endonuclease/exonuclease/phosphatase family protein [Planctomycetes bacterium]|nr:endonuclease/exonuclease/phosphatase family protein [Planctomycetota bacterium]
MNHEGTKSTKKEWWNYLARVVSLLLLAAEAFTTTGARAELPTEIRVVTYNIHHGEGVDREFDLKRIANLLLPVEPHVVALQEVDQGTRRAGGVDQPAELAKLTGMEVVFGRNIDYDGGGYGTAVLTKLPVRSHESVKLKSFYPPSETNPEQRGVQVLELGEKDGPGLLFLNTHLDYRPPDEERMSSAKTINELVAKRSDVPAILAGDLNARPESAPSAELKKEWKIVGEGGRGKAEGGGAKTQASSGAQPLLTFPAEKPDRWIDYVLVRPAEKWEVVEVRVLEEAVASDHRPLLAVLRRKP